MIVANIQISPLLPIGYDLFNDDTSFLNELATEEIQTVLGSGHHGSYSGSYSGGYSGGYSGRCSGGYSGGSRC